jgi:hypothetical protein
VITSILDSRVSFAHIHEAMGETARDDGTPPPVQPQTGRRPRPPLPAAPSSSNTQSFMPQRSRPQLVRRVNTSQGNRFGGRDQSIASHGGLRDRTNSDGSQGGINRSEQILGAGAHAPVTTDIRLLLASLDKQPVEDEAETVSSIFFTVTICWNRHYSSLSVIFGCAT